jgi:hypothetical protein
MGTKRVSSSTRGFGAPHIHGRVSLTKMCEEKGLSLRGHKSERSINHITNIVVISKFLFSVEGFRVMRREHGFIFNFVRDMWNGNYPSQEENLIKIWLQVIKASRMFFGTGYIIKFFI